MHIQRIHLSRVHMLQNQKSQTMYKYCGSAASADKLPTTGQRVGDVYNIETASKYGGAGMNVARNGSTWDPLGEIFSISTITNTWMDTNLT